MSSSTSQRSTRDSSPSTTWSSCHTLAVPAPRPVSPWANAPCLISRRFSAAIHPATAPPNLSCAMFTQRELDVMGVLWEHGPSTAAEVQERLSDRLAYTTVLTVL